MAGQDEPSEFPGVNMKLAAPKKLSAFEREKQAAEAKRRAEEEATAAALKDFKDAFGDEDDDEDQLGDGPGQRNALQGGARSEMPPRRGLRALDEMRKAEQARTGWNGQKSRPPFPSAEQFPSPHHDRDSEYESDNETESRKEPPRPRIELSCLPPAYDETDVKGLLDGHFRVHSVQMLPLSDPDARTGSAMITLEDNSSNTEDDAAITKLQSKYLGSGYRLKLARGLSTAVTSKPAAVDFGVPGFPYGAEKSYSIAGNESLRNAPPPEELRHLGPPGSHGQGGSWAQPPRPAAQAIVKVRPPQDISLVRAIHTLVERLLSEPDPAHALEVEALLIAQPKVQQDVRFAFLFDPGSPAGAYYRHLLWAPYEKASAKELHEEQGRETQRLDDGYIVDWTSPKTDLPFSDLKCLEEVVAHEDYVSSDEEEEDEVHAGAVALQAELEQRHHLRPLQQARLIHLLARIPQNTGHLRNGDIARVTHFAIRHASHGAEEITDWLLVNLMKPLSTTTAAQYEKQYLSDSSGDRSDAEDGGVQRSEAQKSIDPSAARIHGLYLISDVLNNAGKSAGAKNTWRYSKLFEDGFRSQNIFSRLAKVPKELALGRLKTEQWKKRVIAVFETWEGWNLYNAEVLAEFRKQFFEPELTWTEQAIEETVTQASRIKAALESSPAKPSPSASEGEMAGDDDGTGSDIEGRVAGDDLRAVLANGDLGGLRRHGINHRISEDSDIGEEHVDQEMGEEPVYDREEDKTDVRMAETTAPPAPTPTAQRSNRRVRAEDLL